MTLRFHVYYPQVFLTGVGLVTNYKHLSEAERGQIELMWKQVFKQAETSRTLNRSKSTISREIIQNQEFEDFKYYPPKRRQHVYKYNALIAQHNAIIRSRKIGTESKFTKEMSEATSENHLRHWSPEQMVHGDSRVTVSRNTIYNWILCNWIDKVPHSRIRKYRKRSKRKHAALSLHKREMIQSRTIENRPKEVNERKSFGDWEIDCILPSREGKKCIVTINERKSRFTFMALAKAQSALEIIPVIDAFMALHGDAVKSITCDRGKEFANSQFISHIENRINQKFISHMHIRHKNVVRMRIQMD